MHNFTTIQQYISNTNSSKVLFRVKVLCYRHAITQINQNPRILAS